MKYSMKKEGNFFRITALVDIPMFSVRAGDKGGLIERESNLDQIGNAWISENAIVCGNARICGNAGVSGDARISGDAIVSENARISGDVRISGNPWISGDVSISGNAGVSGNVCLRKGKYLLTWANCESYIKTLSDVGGVAWIEAGCMSFCLADAIEHWKDREDRPLTRALLQGAIAAANTLGLKHR